MSALVDINSQVTCQGVSLRQRPFRGGSETACGTLRTGRGTRDRRALRAIALIAALTTAAPARAQTFEEAVRGNIALALQLCLMETGSAQATVSAFVGAGFAYSMRGTPGFDVYHQFAAPAGTVTAELYEGQMAPNCDVMSDHIGTTAAVPVVGALLNQLYPGRFVLEQSSGPGCASFTDYAPAIPFVVSVRGRGEDRPCADIGTIHITSFSAV